MEWADDAPLVDRGLRDRVLERLGLPGPPPPDLGGLRALYAAWCAKVPFDNVRKMLALRLGPARPLPGRSAAEFFENWLAHGAGGTCWPSSNALYALARSLGFPAHRLAGCMRDLDVVSHASVRVTVDGQEWLVDSSMLTNVPVPLGHDTFVGNDPVFPVEVEPADGGHVVWWDSPPNPAYLPCRIPPDPVDLAFYLAAYESSRAQSPFNQRLYARRNRPGELLVLLGRTRFSKTTHGLRARDLSRDELRQALSAEIGISADLVEQWVQAGGLEASFAAPPGPPPPSAPRKPPSQR